MTSKLPVRCLSLPLAALPLAMVGTSALAANSFDCNTALTDLCTMTISPPSISIRPDRSPAFGGSELAACDE